MRVESYSDGAASDARQMLMPKSNICRNHLPFHMLTSLFVIRDKHNSIDYYCLLVNAFHLFALSVFLIFINCLSSLANTLTIWAVHSQDRYLHYISLLLLVRF